MPIVEVSYEHFDRLKLPDSCRALWPRAQEVNWFADEANQMLGVIRFNSESGYRGYVMCAWVNGAFKPLAVGGAFPHLDLAKRHLVERHIAASGVDAGVPTRERPDTRYVGPF